MLPRPNIQELEIKSEVLESNHLGDPHERPLFVYLPPNYDEKRAQAYPVVYLLAAWTGTGESYLNLPDVFMPSIPQLFDRAINEQNATPFICVFPDSSTKLGSSQFVNSETVGRHMDHLCDEIVPFVDAHFHTLKDPKFRSITGHSSGGFGSLVTCMLRPDVFQNLCSSAGDSWHEYLYLDLIPDSIKCIQKEGSPQKFVEKFWSSPNPLGTLGHDSGHTMMMLNICACYAPNPEVPVIKGDIYFDLETGELIPEVWKKILAWDPINLLDHHVEAMKQMNTIQLDAGKDDQYGLHLGHRQLAKKLKTHGIKHRLNEYPGKHGGHKHRFVERIQNLLKNLAL